MARTGLIHEPEAELLSVEDAVQDAARLRTRLRPERELEHAIRVRVPLSALLEAIDQLSPDELRQVARRAEGRLASSAAG